MWGIGSAAPEGRKFFEVELTLYQLTKNQINPWGIGSAGRAPALHAGGQEFESPILHQKRPKSKDSGLFLCRCKA